MKQDDIYKKVADETGYTEEHIKFIIRTFWHTIRKYLTKPHLCLKGITIRKAIVFKIHPFHAKQMVRNVKQALKDNYVQKRIYYKYGDVDSIIKSLKKEKHLYKQLEIYEQIKYNLRNEGQAGKTYYFRGSSEQDSKKD